MKQPSNQPSDTPRPLKSLRLLSRSSVAFAMLLALTLTQATRTAMAADRRPNVILLMPDQMRGQAMGIAGNDQVHTPNLDRLARGGLYLPNTIANNPVCCPARATIVTGVYPHQHGMLVNDLRLRASVTTLAERLADTGYATGFVGKWHLDGGFWTPGFVPPGPRRQGFHFWAANVCNHLHFNSLYYRDTADGIPIKRFETAVWMDEAVRFIQQNKDRPFFLWWACGPPHNPYGAPRKYEKLYDPQKLKLRPNWHDVSQFGSREDIAKYYASITAIDVEVGRLMDTLDTLGLTENTIIIFTSDHGDMLGSQNTIFKCKPWEESIRVPGIIRYPKTIKPGQVRDLLVSHVDLAPTLLSYCEVEDTHTMHGRNLRAQLDGDTTDEPEAVFLQIYEPRRMWGLPDAWRGVRTKRYTYARFRDKPWVLYDLQEDPYQLHNLVDDPAHDVIRTRLDILIQQEMNRTHDNWTTNFIEKTAFANGPALYYHPPDTQPDN